MLLQVLEGLHRTTAGGKLASYQQTDCRSGTQYIYHTLSWSGDAAMALLHSWWDAPLAAGVWPHLVEEAELIELMLQWESAAGLPVRERQQLALGIERQARRLRFAPEVSSSLLVAGVAVLVVTEKSCCKLSHTGVELKLCLASPCPACLPACPASPCHACRGLPPS